MLTDTDLEKIGQLIDRKLDEKLDKRFAEFEERIDDRITQFEERINKNIQFIVAIEIAKHTKAMNKRFGYFDVRLSALEEAMAKIQLDFNAVFLHLHKRMDDIEDNVKILSSTHT